MAETLETPIEQPKISVTEMLNKANQAEQDRRDGKAPAPAVEQPVETKKPEEAGTRDGVHLVGRSDRRRANQAMREAAEERGKRIQLEELIKQGLIVTQKDNVIKVSEPPADDAPQRADFASDEAFAKAKSKHEQAKVEAQGNAEIQKLSQYIAEADQKFAEDVKNLPEWEEVRQAAVNKPVEPEREDFDDDKTFDAAMEKYETAMQAWDQPEYVPAEHPLLMRLIAISDEKARVLLHLAKNPNEMRRLLKISTDGDWIRLKETFTRLEGRVENLYTAKKEEKPKAKPSAAETDAKLARPSEAVKVASGQGTDGSISMTLADGRTINPAWIAQENSRRGVRA